MKAIYVAIMFSLMALLAACGTTESAAVPTQTFTPPPAETQLETATSAPTPTDAAAVVTEPAMEDPTATTEMIATEEMVEIEPTDTQPDDEEMAAEEKEAMADQVDSPHPTETQQRLLDSLTVLGSPAELNNEVWLNSEPLKLADLRGQVVIVEFWTFG